jgi:hypothetical protein
VLGGMARDDFALTGAQPLPILGFRRRRTAKFSMSRSQQIATIRESSRARSLSGKEASTAQTLLNRCLLIFSDLIFDSEVDAGMPSLAAAPRRPTHTI